MRKDEGRSMRRSYHLCRRKPCGEAILVMPALCFFRWLPGCGSCGILVFSRMQRDGTQPVRVERLRSAGGRMNGALDKVLSLFAVLLLILLAVRAWTGVDSPGGTTAWGVDERVPPAPDWALLRWCSGLRSRCVSRRTEKGRSHPWPPATCNKFRQETPRKTCQTRIARESDENRPRPFFFRRGRNEIPTRLRS